MARTILLTTLALMTAFAGCIGDDAPAEVQSTPESPPAQAAPVDVAPLGCQPNNMNNYGTTFQIGDDHIQLDNDHVFWYRESNGVRGTQTEEQCPSNPDTKVVDHRAW